MIITGVGSLPFKDPAAAVEYVLKYDIPYMPELTQLGESMDKYLNSTEPLSSAPFFSEHSLEIAKMQCVGPVTAMNLGLDEDMATLKIIDHISRHLKYIDAKKIILFGLPFAKMWENVFEEFDVVRGIHTCGNMLWDQLFSAQIEIINFDAAQYDITRYYDERTKRIAWGVQTAEDIKDWRSGDLITPACGLNESSEAECEEVLENLKSIKSRYVD
jgi:hypothetical protein